jgi:hypothetical protein
MKWKHHPAGIELPSPKHRDFVIDTLIHLGAFPKLNLELLIQKETKSSVLKFQNVKDVEFVISRHETDIDLAWEKQDLSLIRKSPIGNWYFYWINAIKSLQSDLENLYAAGTDVESLNLYLGSKIKSLVIENAAQSYKLRSRRVYSHRTVFQKFAWWLRGFLIEWRWGRPKKIYGNYEKYHTEVPWSSSKKIRIWCGYCGSSVPDDWKRPVTVMNFDPYVYEIIKNETLSITSYTSVAKYPEQFKCPECQESLQYAQVQKLLRVVNVIFL